MDKKNGVQDAKETHKISAFNDQLLKIDLITNQIYEKCNFRGMKVSTFHSSKKEQQHPHEKVKLSKWRLNWAIDKKSIKD